MSWFSSVGLLGFFGFGSLAVLWVAFTLTAYRAIRRRDVASHRAWMMRSFALTYAAPTLRLWLVLLLVPQLLLGTLPQFLTGAGFLFPPRFGHAGKRQRDIGRGCNDWHEGNKSPATGITANLVVTQQIGIHFLIVLHSPSGQVYRLGLQWP